MSSTLNYIIFMVPKIKPKALLLLNKHSTIVIWIAPYVYVNSEYKEEVVDSNILHQIN